MIILRNLVLVLLIAVLAVLAALAALQPAQAQTSLPDAPLTAATFTAVSDTYLDEADPAANFGGSRTLPVGRTDSRVPTETHLLVRFDLSAIPTGAILDRAELRLYQPTAGTATSYTIFVDEIGAAWEEGAAAWRTALPATYHGDSPARLDHTTGLKTWDVRGITGRWLAGAAPNYGFRLRGDGAAAGSREFSSREFTGQEPVLYIEYHLASPTVTPTRTPTPTATRTPTRTPTTPPLKLADLAATGLEVTQAVQDLNNSVRLVAGKRTFVRFHVRSALGGSVWGTAKLTVQRGDAVAVLAPINGLAGKILIPPNPDRGAVGQAFIFELPDPFRNGAVSLSAQVKTLDGATDGSPANNFASTPVSFESAPGLDIVVFRIGYKFEGTTYYPPQWHVTQMINWLRRAYPTPKISFTVRDLYWGPMWRVWVVDPDTGKGSWRAFNPSCYHLKSKLGGLWVWDYTTGKISNSTRYYGMVDDTIAFMQGCAPVPGRVASGPTGSGTWGWDFDGSYGDWYGGHELAHSFGRRHANFCGAKKGASYPYPAGRISPALTGPAALYGFDASSQAVYGPTWTDLMTYCANEWISDFTYEALLDRFQGKSSLASNDAATDAATALDRLLVSGSIDPTTKTVELEPLSVIPDAPEVEPSIPGPYAIVLAGAGGGELARYPFTPVEMDGGPTLQSAERDVELLSISELVPYVAGTVRVEIEGPGGALLKTVTAGATAPVVTLLSPNDGGALASNPVTVTWSASDAEGDPLTFAVQYTGDDGATWQMVTQSITGTTTLIPRANLTAGSAARFRVWASDGIHTASDASDRTFVVPNLPPTVAIVQPADAAVIVAGQTLALEADAYDTDAGSLDDEPVQWRSSLDGPLGNGAQLTVAGLRIGTHTITVTATDGQAASASASVRVTVLPEDDLPPQPVFLPLVRR